MQCVVDEDHETVEGDNNTVDEGGNVVDEGGDVVGEDREAVDGGLVFAGTRIEVGRKAIGEGEVVAGIALSPPVASLLVTPPVTLLITWATLSSNSELLHPLGSWR